MREGFSGTYAGVSLPRTREPGEERTTRTGRGGKKRGGELTLKQHNKETTPLTDERGRLHFTFLNNSRSRRGRRSVRASVRTVAGAQFPSQRAVKRRFSEPGWIPGRCATLREIWVRIMKDGLNARGEMNGGGAGGCTGPVCLSTTAISFNGRWKQKAVRKALDPINQMPIWMILSLFF